MLDDLKFIHTTDAQDALGNAGRQTEQLKINFELPKLNFIPANIVFAGMGGSALAAMLSQSWPGYKIPFEVCRSYEIPAYVGPKTLFIASSYSGNTEETVAALAAAEKVEAGRIVILTSGGQLQEIAKTKNYPCLLLKSGMQPRHALFQSFKALIKLLEQDDLIAAAGTEDQITKAASFLEEQLAAWRPDIPTARNPAKKLANELMGKSVVIYAGPLFWPAAYKWKISFNENAKNVAWCNQFSEFNHNEFLGWSSHPIDKPYAVIELQSNLENPRIQKRFDITNKLLSGRWPNPHIVTAQGESLLQQLLYIISLGDFVSLYLAILNGINPTPVELIEKLKTELAR